MCGPVGIQGGGGGVVASLADEVFVVASQGGVVAWGRIASTITALYSSGVCGGFISAWVTQVTVWVVHDDHMRSPAAARRSTREVK